MQAKSYLELVNEAIDESKTTLDPLTSVNFADPPRTVMYNRFKRWINRAYRELLMSRNEWYFRNERAALSVWPRLHLAGLTTIPVVGDVLTGDSSGVICTVEAVHTFEDVEEDLVVERTISVTFDSTSDPSNLILRETFSGDNGVPYDAGYLKNFGRYDFREDISELQQIDPNTVRVYHTAATYEVSATLPREGQALAFIPWDKWLPEYDLLPWSGDYPIYITETPQGTYELYPRPDQEYILGFDFTRVITEMVDYDDVPEAIPAEYHDYLVWRAVEEYADFDNNPRLFSRARKHTEDYRNWLDRDQKQSPQFEGSRFNYRNNRGMF